MLQHTPTPLTMPRKWQWPFLRPLQSGSIGRNVHLTTILWDPFRQHSPIVLKTIWLSVMSKLFSVVRWALHDKKTLVLSSVGVCPCTCACLAIVVRNAFESVQHKAEYLCRSILLKFCRCSVGFKSQRCDQKVNPCDYYCQNEGICTLTTFNEPRCK